MLWHLIKKQLTAMPWNWSQGSFGALLTHRWGFLLACVCVNAGVRSVYFRMHVKLKTLDQTVALQGSTMELHLHPIREAG